MFGSKSAERAARDAQATQYYNELKRLSQAPRLTTIDDPEIKGSDKYNAEVQKYNTRLDEFATQLSGKSINEKISPIKQEYTGRIAGILSQTAKVGPVDLSAIVNQAQKPAKVDYTQQAANLLSNQRSYTGMSLSEIVTNHNNTQTLVAEYNSQVDRYGAVAPHRDSMTRLQAMYADYEKLSASVTNVDKTLGISSQMKQKQARLDFEASASGKVLAGQRRAAGKVGKASTILTKGV